VKIGITYNLKPETPPDPPGDASEEFDRPETIEAIAAILKKNGHHPVKLGWGLEAIDRIRSERPEFIFNLAEGFHGRNRESIMPALCELFRIPYTGSDPLTLALTLDKSQAKIIVRHAGVRTPDFILPGAGGNQTKLPPFPLFVKPLSGGSSIGIRLNSIVRDKKELAARISWLRKRYRAEPLLIERFITGREITVGVLGNDKPSVLGIMEIRYKRELKKPPTPDFIYSMEVKRDWENLCEYIVPAAIPELARRELIKSSLSAYAALGCRDIARLDFRLASNGESYFLEANPLPGLNPVSGDIVILAKKIGWTHERLILTILKHAMERQGVLR